MASSPKHRCAIVLAAGKSTRMKSTLPKVLHPVCGRPMLWYVLEACRQAGVERVIVVVGYGKDVVMRAFAEDASLTWVEQADQRGTGHAVQVCEAAVGGFDGQTLVIAGDMPLLRASTVEALLGDNQEQDERVSLATSVFDDPTGYGRILRDGQGRLTGIVEHADGTEEQRRIQEVNVSYYCFDNRALFGALKKLSPANAQGEYYLTDVVRILISQGHRAGARATVAQRDALGVNSRGDLARVNRLMQDRIQDEWLSRGVTIVDRATTWIEAGCRLAEETVLEPFTWVGTGAEIGAGSRVGPFAQVPAGSSVASRSTIGGLLPGVGQLC